MNNCFAIWRYRALKINILYILILLGVSAAAFSILTLSSRRKVVAYLNSLLNFLLQNVYFYQGMMPISKVTTLLAFVSRGVYNTNLDYLC